MWAAGGRGSVSTTSLHLPPSQFCKFGEGDTTALPIFFLLYWRKSHQQKGRDLQCLNTCSCLLPIWRKLGFPFSSVMKTRQSLVQFLPPLPLSSTTPVPSCYPFLKCLVWILLPPLGYFFHVLQFEKQCSAVSKKRIKCFCSEDRKIHMPFLHMLLLKSFCISFQCTLIFRKIIQSWVPLMKRSGIKI